MTHPLSKELRKLADECKPGLSVSEEYCDAILRRAADALNISSFHRDAAINECQRGMAERDELRRGYAHKDALAASWRTKKASQNSGGS